jgi:hypothetical protein
LAELEAIDKHQVAVIEGDRPPAGCIGNVHGADVDVIANITAESSTMIPARSSLVPG